MDIKGTVKYRKTAVMSATSVDKKLFTSQETEKEALILAGVLTYFNAVHRI